jgi:V8-like Glu-specific endopeptidase
VYDYYDLGGWAASIRVAPGKDGAAEPFGAQMRPTDSLWSVAGWVLGGDAQYDYGAVILGSGFAGLSGFLGFDDLAAVGQASRISGYPGDHPQQQWWDDDLVTDVSPHIVSYEIDTAGGQSGSPVWYPAASTSPDVVAVHTRGVGDAACYPNDNCGVRVESSVIGNFNYWRSLSPGGSVGGIAELPVLESAALTEESGPAIRYVALAGALAAGALFVMGTGILYARRR